MLGLVLQLAKEHAGRIDLLLPDIEMPGLTGPDLAAGTPPFAPQRLLKEVQIALQ